MGDRLRSALGLLALGAGVASVIRATDVFATVADEFVQPVDVTRVALRPIEDRDANRALGGARWRRPMLRWSPEERGARSVVGALSFHEASQPEHAWSETRVEGPAGLALRCTSDLGAVAGWEHATVLEFRQSPDLRVTQFRCRVVSQGAAREPWVEPRQAVERVVSRERVEPSATARRAFVDYHHRVEWMELALGALLVLAVGVEFLLLRPARPARWVQRSVYRGGDFIPPSTDDRWRSHSWVRARWWLYVAALAVVPLSQQWIFPIGLSTPDPELAKSPVIEAIPALADAPAPGVAPFCGAEAAVCR